MNKINGDAHQFQESLEDMTSNLRDEELIEKIQEELTNLKKLAKLHTSRKESILESNTGRLVNKPTSKFKANTNTATQDPVELFKVVKDNNIKEGTPVCLSPQVPPLLNSLRNKEDKESCLQEVNTQKNSFRLGSIPQAYSNPFASGNVGDLTMDISKQLESQIQHKIISGSPFAGNYNININTKNEFQGQNIITIHPSRFNNLTIDKDVNNFNIGNSDQNLQI